MSKLKVAALQGLSASSDAITLANDGTCTAKITNNLSNRNLIINGAMQVAQRGTSSTTSGYGSLDRYPVYFGGTDEAPTHAQVDVGSGTTPYTLGFRKALRVTNGNQTSGAVASSNVQIQQRFEAQNLAASGWNYTSTSSYITLSFWVKSSVAQNFYVYLRTKDGTAQRYAFETGSLSADTWTKVTKTIPGNSNLQFDNDANSGAELIFAPFWGTDYTDSGVSLNTWGAYSGSTRTPVNASTWYTTNDATWELTGVQLEVGDTATDFEHRSYAQELALCQRYYYRAHQGSDSGERPIVLGVYENASTVTLHLRFPDMRSTPSLDVTDASDAFMIRRQDGSDHFDTFTFRYGRKNSAELVSASGQCSGNSGITGMVRSAGASVHVSFSADL